MTDDITMEHRNDLLIVRVCTEINQGTADRLLAQVKGEIDRGQHRVILDLSSVEFIDSMGLSIIVDLQESATRSGGKIVIASLTARVARIFRVTRLEKYIEQCGGIEEAEAAFAARGARASVDADAAGL